MRLRIQFSKLGKVRFTSHRDVARIWERALRRSGLPVAYSEGFSPRPKLSFGLALSTGHESDAEYLDVELDVSRLDSESADGGLDLAGLPEALTAQLPVGLTATALVVADRRLPSLQQAVTSCTWRIEVADVDTETVSRAVSGALAAESMIVTRERKGKPVTDDLRPLVLRLALEEPTGEGVRLQAELGTQPRAVRVPELLAALDPPLQELRVHRLAQWTTDDEGQRTDPLSVAAPSPAPAGAS